MSVTEGFKKQVRQTSVRNSLGIADSALGQSKWMR